MIAHNVMNHAELISSLKSALRMCLAALDAASIGATLTTPAEYAQNIRRNARELLAQLED